MHICIIQFPSVFLSKMCISHVHRAIIPSRAVSRGTLVMKLHTAHNSDEMECSSVNAKAVTYS